MSDDEFEQAATEREAAMTGLQPYQVRANRAVPNSLIRDIVADSRCGPTAPSSLASRPSSPQPPSPKGNGWQDAAPLKPIDTRYIDALCDAQDRRDRAVAIQQKMETEWIEHLLDRRNPHKAKTGYDPLQRFDGETPSCYREKS